MLDSVFPCPKGPSTHNIIYCGFKVITILCGWLSKSWSLFGVLNILRHLIFRVPKKGP